MNRRHAVVEAKLRAVRPHLSALGFAAVDLAIELLEEQTRIVERASGLPARLDAIALAISGTPDNSQALRTAAECLRDLGVDPA